MADYSALKATIDASINTNGQQAITGAILNDVLNEMVDVLGEGYTFLGVATPTTNPTTPEGKAYYLAGAAGTYSNFGNIVVNDDEVALLVWDGTAWSKVVTEAASKSVVSQLSQEVDLKTEGAEVVSVSLVEITGAFVNIEGNVRNSNNFAYTEPFFVSKGTTLIMKAKGYAQNIAILSKVVTAGTKYTPLVICIDSTLREYRYEVVEDGDYAMSYSTLMERSAVAAKNTPEQLAKQLETIFPVQTENIEDRAVTDEKVSKRLFESRFSRMVTGLKNSITDFVLNKYVNTIGSVSNLNGWACIKDVEIFPGMTLQLGPNELGYVAKYLVLYDKNGVFISGSFAPTQSNRIIETDSYLAQFPSAKYIAIDFLDPLEQAAQELTETNTADWELVVSGNIPSQLSSLETRVSALEESAEDNIFVFSADDSESYIQSAFDDTRDFRLSFKVRRTPGQAQNPCFNFQAGQLIDKGTGVATTVHNCSDDICPGNYNGGYIGANHGQDAVTITATSHGKTYADIGSKWTDGANNFYIIAIISANEIQLLSENKASYPLWSFVLPNVGTLTHVSGAEHSESIAFTSRTTSQIRPIMSLVHTQIIKDGTRVAEAGTYHFGKLQISQIYSVYNPASVLQKIINAVGSFSANPNFASLGADVVMRHSITYEFHSAQECLVTTDFLAFQNVSLGYFGFTQQGVLSGDNIKMYIPKALPISNGSTTLDFRTIAEHNSVPSTMDLTSQYWEKPNFPPDRWIQFANNISFVGGYLFDKGVGGNERKNVIDNSFFLYTSRKCYPHGIDSKISLSAGQSYGAVNIRKYIPVAASAIPGFLPTTFEYNGELYIYMDSWASGIKSVEIPDKYINGEIVVFEKSDNAVILSSTLSHELLVRFDQASPMYGYIVAKILTP